MSEHTPGPWGISPDGFCIVGPTNEMRPYTASDGTQSLHPSELIALPYGCLTGSHDANARLIAAAPEMYGLIQYIGTHKCSHPNDPVACHFCAARALVVRIKGQGVRA